MAKPHQLSDAAFHFTPEGSTTSTVVTFAELMPFQDLDPAEVARRAMEVGRLPKSFQLWKRSGRLGMGMILGGRPVRGFVKFPTPSLDLIVIGFKSEVQTIEAGEAIKLALAGTGRMVKVAIGETDVRRLLVDDAMTRYAETRPRPN